MLAQLRKTLLVVALIASTACASTINQAPPTASPQASLAFKNTQVLKVLDLIRDVAIDANAQTPPLVSTETTRALVQYHETTIKMMNASVSGWPATALQGIQEIIKRLPASESGTLGGYLNLGVATLKGLL